MKELPHDAGAFNQPPLEGDCLVCPACNGVPAKPALAHFNTGEDSAGHHWKEVTIPCGVCKETGKVSVAVANRFHEGRSHMKERVANGETLYHAARRLGVTPAQLSAYEHGKADLPTAAA